VAIPLLKLYVKASVLGVVVPSSQPKIVSVSTPTIEAAKTTKFTITLKNAGTETDSYDLAIIGAKQVNLQSTRVSLAAGEEQVVPVFIQAAGIIGNYTITATSVNNPTLKDTYSFRLLAEPFCDKQPEAGKIRVATEYGCYYICPNPLDSDQREATCQIFGTFEQSGKPYNRSYAENNNNTKSYANEYHCIAVGKYISLNDYMDDVSTGQRQIFTANSKPNAFWLPAPVCNYVAAYGWHWDGSAADYVESEDYDYSKVPPAGSLVANNTPTASQSSTAQQAIPQLPTGDAGIAVIALIAAIVAWKLVLRR
jgi:hypothetical protein